MKRVRWFGAALVGLLTLIGSSALAQQEPAMPLVTMTEVPGGGGDRVMGALREIDGLDLRDSDWFYQQVRGRAFQAEGVADRSSDLKWVMSGSGIDLLIDFKEEGEAEYRVRLITAEEGLPEHDFIVDRAEEGGPSRGAARLLTNEVERFLGISVSVEEAVAQQIAAQQAAQEPDLEDPEQMRQRAAEEEEARAKRLSRDWFWGRAHFRLFRKDFTVDGRNAVSTYQSGGHPGLELDLEAFPFVLGNPDMVAPGVYVTYNHGFDGVTLIDERGDEPVHTTLSVNNFSIEGGLIYRMDSPLDESNRQLRLKLGARYEGFSITENTEVPSTSLVSLVIGTRLVLPVELLSDAFALTAAVDIVPFSSFGTGAELFGKSSYSYGFGSELGFVFEVIDNIFLSAGYTFRLTRSDFDGDGQEGFLAGSGDPNRAAFADSNGYDLNQGLRAGVVFQY